MAAVTLKIIAVQPARTSCLRIMPLLLVSVFCVASRANLKQSRDAQVPARNDGLGKQVAKRLAALNVGELRGHIRLIDERRAANAGRFRAVCCRERLDALHHCPRQVVRRSGDHRTGPGQNVAEPRPKDPEDN
jgi:hypothetical protein